MRDVGTACAIAVGMANALSIHSHSLALRAAPLFPMRACLDGYSLKREKRVTMDHVTNTEASATVKSSKTRTVKIRGTGDAIFVSCTCSPTSTGDPPRCQHVWAVLLEIDRAGQLEGARTGLGKLTMSALTEEEPKKAAKKVSARDEKSPRATASPKAPPKKAQRRPRRS